MIRAIFAFVLVSLPVFAHANQALRCTNTKGAVFRLEGYNRLLANSSRFEIVSGVRSLRDLIGGRTILSFNVFRGFVNDNNIAVDSTVIFADPACNTRCQNEEELVRIRAGNGSNIIMSFPSIKDAPQRVFTCSIVD